MNSAGTTGGNDVTYVAVTLKGLNVSECYSTLSGLSFNPYFFPWVTSRAIPIEAFQASVYGIVILIAI